MVGKGSNRIRERRLPLSFHLVKTIRAIRIFFGDYKEVEETHFLFILSPTLSPEEITQTLIPHCYQYNPFSTTFRRQVLALRKFTDLWHQIHLRFYYSGDKDRNHLVSGHWELIPEMFPKEHLDGLDLRSLTPDEINPIKEVLEKRTKLLDLTG